MRRYLLLYLNEPLNPICWLWMQVGVLSVDKSLEYKLLAFMRLTLCIFLSTLRFIV